MTKLGVLWGPPPPSDNRPGKVQNNKRWKDAVDFLRLGVRYKDLGLHNPQCMYSSWRLRAALALGIPVMLNVLFWHPGSQVNDKAGQGYHRDRGLDLPTGAEFERKIRPWLQAYPNIHWVQLGNEFDVMPGVGPEAVRRISLYRSYARLTREVAREIGARAIIVTGGIDGLENPQSLNTFLVNEAQDLRQKVVLDVHIQGITLGQAYDRVKRLQDAGWKTGSAESFHGEPLSVVFEPDYAAVLKGLKAEFIAVFGGWSDYEYWGHGRKVYVAKMGVWGPGGKESRSNWQALLETRAVLDSRSNFPVLPEWMSQADLFAIDYLHEISKAEVPAWALRYSRQNKFWVDYQLRREGSVIGGQSGPSATIAGVTETLQEQLG